MKQVDGGIYAGIFYTVFEKEGGALYIGLESATAAQLASEGADMTLLNNIGDQDPEDVMAAFVQTLPPTPKPGDEE